MSTFGVMEDSEVDVQLPVVGSSTSITDDDDPLGISLSPKSAQTNLAKKTSSCNGGDTQDMRSWRKILLQWISECNFIERNYFNIEQSNIEGFYEKYLTQMINGANTHASDKRLSLKDFLKDQYPDFDPNFDDENQLSSADYIYLYSLLMHYCCIKCPDDYFHNTCKKLSNSTQNCIASFFKLLFDSETYNRDNLRQAIAAIVEANPSPTQIDSSSSLLSPTTANIESPIKTPKRGHNHTQRIPPSTPKTFLLEERTRELFNLRAQLETERYEKGVLEVQIKQYEDSIGKINQNHNKLVQEIQELKAQLLTKNTESVSKNRGNDDQIKRRLCKDISQKEEQISILSDTIRTLEDDKNMLMQKLQFAQNQVIICMDRVNELDCRVEELNLTLQQQNLTIKSLNDNKMELEQYICEVRAAAAANKCADFNLSFDCLDTSFARTMNSSSSVPSPENLGVSVIDVQLREIEKENQILREESENWRQNNTTLAESIHAALSRHWQDYGLIYGSQLDAKQPDQKEDPLDELELFVNFVDKLSQSYTNERECVRKLKTDTKLLRQTNETLNKKLTNLEDELQQLKECANLVASNNERLDKEKLELEKQLKTMDREMKSLKQHKLEINTQLNEVNDDYQNYIERSKREIKQIQNALEESQQKTKKLNQTNVEISEKSTSLAQELTQLEKKFNESIKRYEERICIINDILFKTNLELETSKSAEKAAKDKSEELYLKIDKLKSNGIEADAHLKNMSQSLLDEQQKAQQLGKEIKIVLDKNKELEQRISELQAKQEKDEESYKTTVNQVKHQELEIKLLYNQSCKDISAIQTEYTNAKSKIQSFKDFVEGLFALFKEPMLSKNLTENLPIITEKIITLISQAQSQIEFIKKLEFLSDEQEIKIANLEEQYQYANVVQLELQAKMSKDSAEYEAVLTDLKQQHQIALDELNRKLSETQQLHQTDREAHAELEQSLKIQIDELNQMLQQTKVENDTNFAEVQKLKIEYTAATRMLTEAQDNARELNQQITEYTEEKQEMEERLKFIDKEAKQHKELLIKSEERNQQQEQELKQQMDLQQKSDESIQMYEQELQEQINLLQEQNQICTVLEKTSNELRIELHNAELKEAELLKQLEAYAEQEKYLLDLVAVVDNLKKEVQEKQEEKLAICKKNTELHADLVAKEAELRLALDELSRMRDELNAKFTTLTAKLTECTAELEYKDWAIEDILAVLENNYNLKTADMQQMSPSELVGAEAAVGIYNLFNVAESDDHDNFKQLKCSLNRIMYNYKKLTTQLHEEQQDKQNEIELKTSTSMAKIKELTSELERRKAEIKELQEQLANEVEIKESRLKNELRQLFSERENLENVNQKLTDENAHMQQKLSDYEDNLATLTNNIAYLNADKAKLDAELKVHVENHKKHEHKLQERFKEQQKQVETARKQAETELEKVKAELVDMEKQKQISATKLKQLEQKHHQLQQKHKELQAESDKQQEQHATLSKSNESLESKLEHKISEITTLKIKQSEYESIRQQLEAQNASLTKSVSNAVTEKLSIENKFAQLLSDHQQNVRDLEVLKIQQQTAQADIDRLTVDIECLKQEKQELQSELKDKERELQRANDNLTQLIQEVASIRREKEGFFNENQLLSKQLNEISKLHESSESQLKEEIQNKINDRQMLDKMIEEYMSNLESVRSDNIKMRDTVGAQTKQVEEYEKQLNDTKERNSKLECDNVELTNTIEACAKNVESLQRERDHLQENLALLERNHEVLGSKLTSLEITNSSLREAHTALQNAEAENLAKLKKLEKTRQAQDEKLRVLNTSLAASDAKNNLLNLEVGALNSQLVEVQNTNRAEYAAQIENLNEQLNTAKEQTEKYQELHEKLRIKREQLEERNADLNDQLSKISLSLNIKDKKFESIAHEVQLLTAELLIMREKKEHAAHELKVEREQFAAFKVQKEQNYANKCNELKKWEKQVLSLETELVKAVSKEQALQKELSDITARSVADKMALESNQQELNELRARVKLIADEMDKEKETATQLRLDNQILQAKYRESKQLAIAQSKASEERIKENRLELEGKLEKMKSKMKTLYTDEIAKAKTKHERELALLKADCKVYKDQNAAYEDNRRNLAKQVVSLNDRLLALQTDNKFLTTKIKHLENKENNFNTANSNAGSLSSFKRPTSLASSSGPSTNTGTNLEMEDEEGEVFNNTYLTDLKNGGMNRDVCAEELKFRNSLMPPHLQSSYAAQYQHFPEDDIKVSNFKDDHSRQSLDDSSCILLSTTAGGTRKKFTGVTNYKRPGPPTPSKNGGRLSLGSSEPTREILKETYDGSNIAHGSSSSSSSAKTPARFNFFASRFSMGNSKEEQQAIPPSTAACQDLRRTLHKKKLEGVGIFGFNNSARSAGNMNGGLICTSTPRKSKTHDLRRKLEQVLTSTPKEVSMSPLAMHRRRKSRKIYAENNIEFTPLTALPTMVISAPIAVVPTQQLIRYSILNAAVMPQINCASCRSQSTSKLTKSYVKRLKRRAAVTSTTDDTTTTNSPASSKRSIRCCCKSVDDRSTPPSSSDKFAKLDRKLRRRSRRTARPSLNVRGNMFAKHGRQGGARGAFKDINRAMHINKNRQERNDDFYKNRAISSDICDETTTTASVIAAATAATPVKSPAGTIVVDATFDLSNNNYSLINRNKLNETMSIVKSEDISLPEIINDLQLESHSFVDNELTDSDDDDADGDEFEDEIETKHKDFSDYDEVDFDLDNDNNDDDKNIAGLNQLNFSSNSDKVNDRDIKYELITTQELQDFDEQQEQRIKLQEGEEFLTKTTTTVCGLCSSKRSAALKVAFDTGDSQHFEHLLTLTQSQAPFELNLIKFNNTTNLSAIPIAAAAAALTSSSSSSLPPSTLATTYTPKYRTSASNNSSEFNQEILPCSTALSTTGTVPSHTPTQLSRTIYGGNVIINRRLPHINTTYMRKSSIYIKNQDPTANDDIILVTNQTINFVDLLRMWQQMSNPTRCFICFTLLASFTTIWSLLAAYIRS